MKDRINRIIQDFKTGILILCILLILSPCIAFCLETNAIVQLPPNAANLRTVMVLIDYETNAITGELENYEIVGYQLSSGGDVKSAFTNVQPPTIQPLDITVAIHAEAVPGGVDVSIVHGRAMLVNGATESSETLTNWNVCLVQPIYAPADKPQKYFR